MKKYTFSIGGVHPSESKMAREKAIERLPIPKQVIIPLAQHIGAPAKAIVAKGDIVRVGTLIGEADGLFSANIHSSVSGIVAKVDNHIDSSGTPRPAVYINIDGNGDKWEQQIITHRNIVRECDLTAAEILQRIAAAGIVGMGGATFPTSIKLNPPRGTHAELLLINGAECEPYLTADHRLMLERGQELLIGASIVMKALRIEQAIIGIEANKPDAIKLLKKQKKKLEFSNIKIASLKTRYPQGGEKQLIAALTGRHIESGKLPISVGVVVQNVSTIVAIYEAVQKNKPLIERIVTVAGPKVSNPVNLLTRIGTPYSDLIEWAGGMPDNTAKIISGGPMMGKAVLNTSIPVSKGTSGIVLLPESESLRKPMENCIRCAKCVDACPMGLEPYLLMRFSESAMWIEAEHALITDCIECGSCSYTCPSHRPQLDYIRLGKANVIREIRNRK